MSVDNELKLTQHEFRKLTAYFYNQTGILLKDHKKYLVEHRLGRIIGNKKWNFKSYDDFYQKLVTDKAGELKALLIQALTTNWTFFFRDDIQFNFVADYLKANYDKEDYLRLWSAGCATGEEAYSLSIVALETIPRINQLDFRILATDISLPVLQTAMTAKYHYTKIKGNIPDKILKKYFIFDKIKKDFILKNEVKSMVYFRYLNLMDNFPFQKKYDLVFIRNVLIYFGKKEKEHILNKIYNILKDKGFLFLGLSESLVDVSHQFKLVKNSIYAKQ